MKADRTFEIVAEIRKGSNSVEMYRVLLALMQFIMMLRLNRIGHFHFSFFLPGFIDLFLFYQHYWKQLKPFAATQYDVTHGPLKQAELLFNWKNRFVFHWHCIKRMHKTEPNLKHESAERDKTQNNDNTRELRGKQTATYVIFL